MTMSSVDAKYKHAADLYNKGKPHFPACENLISECLNLLKDAASYRHYGFYSGNPNVEYYVFDNQGDVSRPVRPDLFIDELSDFEDHQSIMISDLKSGAAGWNDDQVKRATRVIYTSVMSFACCIDLWKRSSRKTPGTFFEVYFAGLMPFAFPDAVLSKHIPLPGVPNVEEDIIEEIEDADDGSSSVATDLVVSHPEYERKIVIPLKITTRERIVQPFAHQRILDSAFSSGMYNSFLTCVSETQLDKKTQSVKQVCVPGTVKLFQRHLGNMTGLYYCDVPQRYAAPDMAAYLPVKEIGEIFKDFGRYFNG